jgi:hypothetical protein
MRDLELGSGRPLAVERLDQRGVDGRIDAMHDPRCPKCRIERAAGALPGADAREGAHPVSGDAQLESRTGG